MREEEFGNFRNNPAHRGYCLRHIITVNNSEGIIGKGIKGQ